MNQVLIISDYFYPHWTGVSKSIFNLVKALRAEFEFTVLTVRHESKLPAQERIAGARVLRSPPFFSFSRAKYSLSLLFRAYNQIKQHQVVLVNSPCTNVLPIAILTKLLGKKLIIFHQGDLILTKGLINQMIERAFDFCTVTSLSLADKVGSYTLDYAQHSRVLRYFLDKFEAVIWPLPEFKKDSEQLTDEDSVSTKIKSLKDKQTVFGFAGRFVHEKGFDVLFKAIASSALDERNYHFVFAGETDVGYEQTYQKSLPSLEQIKDKVSFMGLLSGSELNSFYREIDCFVLSSRSECFALVQPEAMAQKTPVIAPDIPGARQVVKKTSYGWLFEAENAQSLAQTLIEADQNLSSIKANYHQVQKLFDYDKLSQKAAEFIFSSFP